MTYNIDGYVHISHTIDTANQWIKKLSSGEIRPLVSSLKIEQEKIGGWLPGEQIVIAGRTGCVLKGTKIIIRKKVCIDTEKKE